MTFIPAPNMVGCACADPTCATLGCKLFRQTPAQPLPWSYGAPIAGCICPPTSEQTCQSPTCPRKGVSVGGPTTCSSPSS